MTAGLARYAGQGALAAGVLATGWLVSPKTASAVCSVFDGQPCRPYSCSVFDTPPCIPEVQYPIGDGLRLTVHSLEAESAPRPHKPLRNLHDLFATLRACWVPPPIDEARPGMQISVRLSFRRDGSLLGKPFITFQTHEATENQRLAYRVALMQALERCTPLPLSAALGGAIAGRPISIRFIDNRKLKQAERPHD
jgi:hypothetical protein